MKDVEVIMEERLQQLEAELRQAQKMAALGELASTITHEFNNVLMTVINYAKLGLRHNDQPTRDKALSKILGAAQRAEKITNGVLGLARNRGHDKVPTDLASLVEQSLVLLEREMRKYRVHIQSDFAAVPKALVCGNQIQQVLLNLLTNARQAMPTGGQITIRVAEDGEAKMVDLSIRDTGEGIPADQLPRIFDRHYSTKQGPDASGKGGMGLGLAMCREIVQAHGGRVRVESTVGMGTCFTLKLPVAPEVAAAPIGLPKLGVPTVPNATA